MGLAKNKQKKPTHQNQVTISLTINKNRNLDIICHKVKCLLISRMKNNCVNEKFKTFFVD